MLITFTVDDLKLYDKKAIKKLNIDIESIKISDIKGGEKLMHDYPFAAIILAIRSHTKVFRPINYGTDSE